MRLLFRFIRNTILSFAVLASSFALVFSVKTGGLPTVDSSRRVLSKVIPALDMSCRFPLSYRIGAIDPRFHFSDAEFLKAIADAEAIWEGGLDRNLFESGDTSASLPIHLVFDNRQEQTDSIKEVSSDIEEQKASYESLRGDYEAVKASFDREKSIYDAVVKRYESHLDEYERRAETYLDRVGSYEKQVAEWNAEGGAPPDEYEELEDTRKSLKKEASNLEENRDDLDDEKQSLEKKFRALNALLGKVNTLAGSLNRLAGVLNITVDSYNQVYGAREEFTTGLYTEENGEARIDVFQFYDYGDLVLILAHEMGHALGIEHATRVDSMMYPSVGEQKPTLTDEDRRMFEAACPTK